ncbi:MAG: NADH-quinone oxidoreductase subunit NuoH [Elusimicrobia bacterium]|nr:NADH-quinone oxidoreductase subunit NuoH [Elusimicrobiota bacterium]
MILKGRAWPTELWDDPWKLPRYRRGARMLAGLSLGALAAAVGVGELGPWLKFADAELAFASAALGLPDEAVDAAWILVKVAAVVAVFVAAPVVIVWWERKISAHMQSRFGPMRTGGFHGWLQTVADGIKLLLKENITPAQADSWVHRLAPAVALVPALVCFAPVSFGQALCAADIDIGTLYVFAMAGVSVMGIMMAGWGSGNKYSLLGGLRSAAQLVSYELPRTFSVVPVIMFAGSLNLTRIVAAQQDYWFGFLPKWFIFYPVVGQLAFVLFLIASVAETNRTPFDIPEAESELVSGFHTEYSGIKFSLFFMAEYGYMLLSCFLLATFFLGGGSAPLPFLKFIPSWAWFFGKSTLLIFCFLWFRWTFPRLRVDRLMDFNWKFLLPWSFANIAFAGLCLLF